MVGRSQTKDGAVAIGQISALGQKTESELWVKGLEFCDNRRSLFLDSLSQIKHPKEQATPLEEVGLSDPVWC